MRAYVLSCLLACGNLVFSQGNSPIQTATLSPSKDAFVAWKSTDGSWANTTYGTHQQLFILSGTHSGSPTLYRSFMTFDLSSIPANAVIISAELYLYAYGDHSQTSGSNDGRVHALNAAWAESTLTWNNQPGFTTSSTDPVLVASTVGGSNSPGLDYVVDVSALVRNQVGLNEMSFVMKLSTESGYRKLHFWSKEYTTSGKRPKLVVTYINQFVEVRPDETGAPIWITSDALPFTYAVGEVSTNQLVVLNEERETILTQTLNSSAGDNFGVIDLSDTGTFPKDKRYTMQIIWERKETYYIHFYLPN